MLALLKAIVAFGGREVKDYLLIDALWADQEGDVARDAFRVALHRLRKLLGRSDAIDIDDGRVSLESNTCAGWMPSHWKRTCDGPRRRALLSPATAGPFCRTIPTNPGALRCANACALASCGRRNSSDAQLERDGEFEAARDFYLRALDLEATAETLHQGLMRCHAALGATRGSHRRLPATVQDAGSLARRPARSRE